MKLLTCNVEPQYTPPSSAPRTGRHPIRSDETRVVWGLPHGLVGWEVTIAELFSDADHQTAMFGRWPLGVQVGRYPTDHGFDVWYGLPNTTGEAKCTSQFGFDPKVVEPPQIVEAMRGVEPTLVMNYDYSVCEAIDAELTERDGVQRSQSERWHYRLSERQDRRNRGDRGSDDGKKV